MFCSVLGWYCRVKHIYIFSEELCPLVTTGTSALRYPIFSFDSHFFLQFLKTRLMTAEARTNARRFQSVLARILAPNGAGCNKATHVIFEARWWYQVFITYGTMAAVKLRTSASSMYMYRVYMLLRSTVRAISCYRCRPFGPSSDVEFDEVVFLPFAIPRVHYFIKAGALNMSCLYTVLNRRLWCLRIRRVLCGRGMAVFVSFRRTST